MLISEISQPYCVLSACCRNSAVLWAEISSLNLCVHCVDEIPNISCKMPRHSLSCSVLYSQIDKKIVWKIIYYFLCTVLSRNYRVRYLDIVFVRTYQWAGDTAVFYCSYLYNLFHLIYSMRINNAIDTLNTTQQISKQIFILWLYCTVSMIYYIMKQILDIWTINEKNAIGYNLVWCYLMVLYTVLR